MFKNALLTLAIIAVAVIVKAGVVSADHNPNHQATRVTICHSTQPQPSNGNGQGPQNNPYVRQTVNQSSIFNNPNGHNYHDGPIFNNSGQNYWGDIIPPFGNYAGLNWTQEGQDIYNNNCGFVTEGPFVTFAVACVNNQGDFEAVVTLTNSGQADGSATVNGQNVDVPAGTSVDVTLAPGINIEIVIDQQTVYNDTPECEGAGGQGAGTTSDPADPVVQVEAPRAGVNAGAGSIAVLGAFVASVLAAIYGVLRLRKSGV